MSESPFKSLIDRFTAVEHQADYITRELMPHASEAAISNTCVRLAWLLVRFATIAVNRTPEFGEYPPLRERFLNNMKRTGHIRRYVHTITVFDPRVAGTHEDLLRGWAAAGRSFRGTKKKRLLGWKYGIYLPARADFVPEDGKVIADYRQIIDVRLAQWRTKAPYWYFINYGNEGFGAYPHFQGTFFVEQTRRSIPRILREEMKHVGDFIPRGTWTMIRKSYRQKRVVKEAFDRIYPSTGVPEGYRVMRVTKGGAIQWQNVETGQIAAWTRII